MLINLQNRRLVSTPIAIIRRRKNRHHIPVLTPIIPFHHQLMRPRYQRKPVVVVERLRDVLPKRVAGATRRYAPAAAVVGVGPEQIAHGAFVGDFLYAVQSADVVEGVDAGGEAAVETEDLVLDQCRQGEVVEEIGEVFPDGGVAVFAQAFVVETVDLGDLTGFVVAAQDGDAVWVADFEGDEESYGFDGEVAAVDVVA